jgi:hypothetical protein
LVSISFRRYSVDDILTACHDAGLSLIEWGSDVHVKVGDAALADAVAEKTRRAGLRCISYGSYFRLGATPIEEIPLYIDSASRLGARNIRVWCGVKGSALVTPEERERVVIEGRMFAEAAHKAGLNVTLECHCDTLTDDYRSAMNYITEVNHPAMRLYWQPSQFYDVDYNLAAAAAYAPYTECLHVFQWDRSRRYPLCEGSEVWAKYLNIFRDQPREIGLLLEFMHDDRLESLQQTASTLKSWIG